MGFMDNPVKTGEWFNGDGSNSVRLEGAEDLVARLFAIPGNVGKKYMKQAVKAAMRPLRAQLLANTPMGPRGNLRMAVGDKVKLYDTGVAFGVVGYQRAVSKDTADNKGFHSHFVEFGTKARYPRKGPFLSSFRIKDWTPPGWRTMWPLRSRFVRPARARHPMERAYQQTGSQCKAILETQMADALDRALKDTGG